MPLLGNMKGGWRMAVHPKTGDVAVINGNKLRGWNFQTSKASKKFDSNARSFDFAGEPWRLARVAGQWQNAVLEILDTRIAGFDKKPIASFKDAALNGAQLSASKDGTVIAANNNGNTRIYRRQDATLSESFKGNNIQRYGPHWVLNSSGTRLWTGFGVYDTANGNEICKMERNGVDIPPNSAGLSDWLNASTIVEIALVKADWPGAPEDAVERAMLLWNAETGKQILRVDAPDANGLCISPDGKQICEAGNDMRLRLRNAQTLGVEKEFRAHDGAISDVEWHPKLPLLISSSEDLTVRIWNVKDGHLVEELHGIASQPDQRTERVAVSPEGSLLALKAGGGQVGIYEPESFKPPQRQPSAAPPAQLKPNPAQGAPQAPSANSAKQSPAPPQKPGAASSPPNSPTKSE
jgi:WD40 repeat protein